MRMIEPTDHDTHEPDAPHAIPFPTPREPEPDYVAWAVAKLDINRLPAGLRDSSAALVRGAAAARGARPVRLADTEQDEEGGRE